MLFLMTGGTNPSLCGRGTGRNNPCACLPHKYPSGDRASVCFDYSPPSSPQPYCAKMSFLRGLLEPDIVVVKSKTLDDLPVCNYTADDDDEDFEDDSTNSDRESENNRPPVYVTKKEVCPDLTAANAMVVGLQEMATCKGMFDKWAQELDR